MTEKSHLRFLETRLDSVSFITVNGSVVLTASQCDLLCALFHQTPEWLDSDSCQKCDQPFFWNFKQMWDNKKIGLRQVGDMDPSSKWNRVETASPVNLELAPPGRGCARGVGWGGFRRYPGATLRMHVHLFPYLLQLIPPGLGFYSDLFQVVKIRF